MDTMTWPETKKRFARIFESKTRHEWQTIFNGTDACVTPVLEMSDASGIGQDVMSVSHNRQRNILVQDPESGGHYEPSPAPRLSNYKINNGFKVKRQPAVGEHTVEILKEFKVPQLVIDSMLADKVVMDMSLSSSSKL